MPAETFTVDSLAVSPLFEGHRSTQVEGRWSEQAPGYRRGCWLVPGAHRSTAGALAAYLLEPASEDGLVTWNLLDRELQAHEPYPILRVRGSAPIPMPRFPKRPHGPDRFSWTQRSQFI